MTSRAFRAGIAGAVTLTLSMMAGCVDDDPIVSGNRPDAGSTDSGPSTPSITTIIPADDFPDGGDVDDPRCRKCADTLITDKPRGTLCRKNNAGGTGKSSVELLNGVVDCVCYDKCAAKCGNYCSGGKTDLICSSCITQGCNAQLSACQGDF